MRNDKKNKYCIKYFVLTLFYKFLFNRYILRKEFNGKKSKTKDIPFKFKK